MIDYKKMKNIMVAMTVALGLIMSACDITIDETDSLITEGSSDVFNGVENPGSSIDNLYNTLSGGGQMDSQEELYAMSVATTDEQLVPTRGTDWGDNGVWRTLHTHTWSSTHRDVIALWNNKNALVLRSAEIIDPLSEATPAQVAQAKFMRAYAMWIIMDAYGQVPYR